MFARAAGRGVEVRVGRGLPLNTSYVRGDPDSPALNKFGGNHAKVLYGTSTKTALVGSCNFSTSSQCNRELTVKVALSTSGVVQLTNWFQDLWNQGTTRVISSGPAPSRSPTRPRSRNPRGSPPSQQ